MLDLLSKKSVLHCGADMSRFTTIRAGGIADYLLEAGSIEDIAYAEKFCKNNGVAYYVAGRGSNLLVRDGGFRGLIIRIAKPLFPLTVSNGAVCASAGEPLANVVRAAVDNSLTGLEFAGAIPGSLGGAIAMNAGAHGGEISGFLEYAEVLQHGQITRFSNAECCFSYRNSRFLTERGLILTGAVFRLKTGGIKAMEETLRRDREWRGINQPKGVPNAGSAYKRLKECSAGELIDKCGLKGYNIGGAEVSQVHANFLINRGGAKASDFISLMEYIEKTVAEKTGYVLEREIEIIGEV